MKRTFVKLLPFVVGGTLGILLFHPPAFLRELGIVAYVMMAGLVVVLFMVFVGFLLLANLPANLQLEPALSTTLPSELQPLLGQLTKAGFVAAGGPRWVAMTPPALLIPLVHGTEPIYASLFRTGTVPAKVSYDCVSIFEGGRGGLTTGPDIAGAFVPGTPGSLRQIFPKASPAELLAHHRQALAYLKTRGIVPRPASSEDFEKEIRQAMARGREAFLRRPVKTTATVVWRSLTRSTPHVGPVDRQAIAEKEIRSLVDTAAS